MSKKWFSHGPSTHGTTRFPYCAEPSPGSSWIFIQIHMGTAILKTSRLDDIIYALYPPPPRPKPNCLGPSDNSLLTATMSQPLTKSHYTFLTLNVHSPLAHEAFIAVLRLSFGSFFLLPRAPSKCLKHSRSGPTSALWPQHSLALCDSPPPPRMTPTLRDHHFTCHLSSTSHL